MKIEPGICPPDVADLFWHGLIWVRGYGLMKIDLRCRKLKQLWQFYRFPISRQWSDEANPDFGFARFQRPPCFYAFELNRTPIKNLAKQKMFLIKNHLLTPAEERYL